MTPTDEPQDPKIEMVDPNTILMSLPTISDALPAAAIQAYRQSLDLEIMEDDWMQVEFVSADEMPHIKQEIEAINTIIEEEAVKIDEDFWAFKNLHVRALIKAPLKQPITMDEFKGYFNNVEVGSLSFTHYGVASKSSYLKVGNVQLYCRLDQSNIIGLGLYGLLDWEGVEAFNANLKQLMLAHNLVLVDWLGRTVIDVEDLENYLSRGEEQDE